VEFIVEPLLFARVGQSADFRFLEGGHVGGHGITKVALWDACAAPHQPKIGAVGAPNAVLKEFLVRASQRRSYGSLGARKILRMDKVGDFLGH